MLSSFDQTIANNNISTSNVNEKTPKALCTFEVTQAKAQAARAELRMEKLLATRKG